MQLITYADRLGDGGIPALHRLLRTELAGLFGGVHLLPFFHRYDGADAGFDPIDHRRVDERLGTWDDVRALGAEVPVTADLIVNHLSVDSPECRDFRARGEASPYRDLFLTREKVFGPAPNPAALARIRRTRDELPFSELVLDDGRRVTVWTTFTPRQIDLDVRSAAARDYLDGILRQFADAGVEMVRLDAAGYAVKAADTSCFMLPETLDFIGELTRRAHALGLKVLVEMRGHHRDQLAVAPLVDRVYDFALLPLFLHAWETGDAQPLGDWLARSPRNAVTVLDTHDGIGLDDVAADPADPVARPGLLDEAQCAAVIARIHERSGGGSRLASGTAASNVDHRQVNCTLRDALGREPRALLAARALQFFVPGLPQVYYAGLLAAENDLALLRRSGVGRDVNRPFFRAGEVAARLAHPVVAAQVRLIRWRNEQPAFGGEFALGGAGPGELELVWRTPGAAAVLRCDFRARRVWLTEQRDGGAAVTRPLEEVFTA